jgi:hypothetical protein
MFELVSKWLASLIICLGNLTTSGPDVPSQLGPWKLISVSRTNDGFRQAIFSAQVNEINCQKGLIIEFPPIFHGAHEFSIDGKIIAKSGSFSFEKSNPFYNEFEVACSIIIGGAEITWRTTSYSDYFFRFVTAPKVKAMSVYNFWINDITILAILVLIVQFLVKSNIYLRCSSLFIATYSAISIGIPFNLPVSMKNSHKISDIALWAGVGLLGSLVGFSNLTRKMLYFMFSLGIFLILLANGGDSIQAASTLCFLPGTLTILALLKNVYPKVKKTVIAIVMVGMSFDILSIFGILDFPISLPIYLALLISSLDRPSGLLSEN